MLPVIEDFARATGQPAAPLARWLDTTVNRSGDPDTMCRILGALLADSGNRIEVMQSPEQYRHGDVLTPITTTMWLALRAALGTAAPAPSAVNLRPMRAASTVEPATDPAPAEHDVFNLPADLF